ncbi:MAG: hypothetical protein WD314_01995 [Trueperaceae bacterium]
MKTAKMIATPVSALLLACLSASVFAQDEPGAGSTVDSASLPVTRVVLFTSGIGYFEHAGTVDGTAELELPVAGEQMDDLLASLVLQDFGGGTIEPVRYPARDPLGRVLASYSLDLTNDPTLAELLSQARGEAVLVTATEPLEGTIVNLERVQVPEEEPKTYLTLAMATGLQRVSLAEVRRVRFARPELQQELESALAALARYRGEDEGNVRLRFSGSGSRRVSVGYIREVPVWKTSYRLLVGDEGEADLQGWAIFDNPTSLDLSDITVSFVAGQPISFISSLYAPVYVERPRVEASTTPGIVPPAYAADAAPPEPARMAARERAQEQGQAMREALQFADAGVAAMAEGGQTGASFEYRVLEPVTVARYESAMIPIIQQRVEAQRLSIYDSSILAANPLHGVRLVNDTGLHLAAGPVTVFDAGGFAGNSRIADIVPGDSRILTYAVDLGVEFETTSSSEPERVTAVSIRNGVFETSVRQRVTREYRATARGEQGRLVIIEHPKRSGFEVVSPDLAPAETAGSYRFGMLLAGGNAGTEAAPTGRQESDETSDPVVPVHRSCQAGAPCTLEVVMERVDSRRIAATNVTGEQIAFYLENVELSQEDRERLARVLELKRRLTDLERSISEKQSSLDAIHRDQNRVRQNMAALDRNSSLYRRYLADLETQEDTLDAVETEIAELRGSRLELQEQLDLALEDF